MKKYTVLLFIAVVFVYSCKKNHNADVNPSSIVGTWFVTADTVKDFDKTGQTSATENHYNLGQMYRFNADGSGFTSIDTTNQTFTYIITSGNAVLSYPMLNYKGDQIDTARIGTLTSTSLELIYKGYFYDLNGSTAYFETDVFLTRQTQMAE